mgnify:CR=1 FL=1
MSNILKEALSRYLASKGLVVESEGSNDNKEYPKSHNLHLMVNGGDEHHVIQGVKHSWANQRKVFDKAVAHVAKKTGHDHEAVEDALGSADYHHHLVDKSDLHNKPDRVHKSIDDYVKYHSKGDTEWVKDELGD